MNTFEHIDLRKLLDHAYLGVVIHRWDTSIAYANPAALRMLNMKYEEVINKYDIDPCWHFVDEQLTRLGAERYPVNLVRETKKPLFDYVLGQSNTAANIVNWFRVNAYYEGEKTGERGFIIVTFNDVEVATSSFSFREIVERTQDVVVVTEAEDIEAPLGPKIVYVNKAFEDLTGYKATEVIGETPRILQGHHTDKATRERIKSALEAQQPISETILNYSKRGQPYWLEMNIFPLKSDNGKVEYFAAIERDVTERLFYLEQIEKRNEDLKLLKENLQTMVNARTEELHAVNRKLEFLAFNDPLTGLPNRRYFVDQGNRVIKFCQRYHCTVMVGIIDIDNFKHLNDTYGHDCGDEALKIFSNTLLAFFRQDDAFCRYGGEEFAFIVSLESSDKATQFIKRLASKISRFTVTTHSGVDLPVTVSAGATLCSPDHDTLLFDLLKRADTLLLEAKNEGKARILIENEQQRQVVSLIK